MQLVFVEPSNGLRLTKHVSATETRSYPNVKAVTSHHYDVTPSAEGMRDFSSLLRKHSAEGHSLLKGRLKKQLNN